MEEGNFSQTSDNTDYSDSESISSHRRKKKAPAFIPCVASDWKIKDLKDIGIHYNEAPLSLHDLMSYVRRDLRNKFEIPDVSKKLINLTNEVFSFSIDLGEKTKSESIWFEINETEVSINNFKSAESEFRENFSEDNDKKSGDLYPGYKTVTGTRIDSNCAVRFTTLQPNGHFLLALVTEVKKEDVFKREYTSETFRADNIRDDVLGHHGIGLVIEARDSYFYPCICGIICIGTKAIFMKTRYPDAILLILMKTNYPDAILVFMKTRYLDAILPSLMKTHYPDAILLILMKTHYPDAILFILMKAHYPDAILVFMKTRYLDAILLILMETDYPDTILLSLMKTHYPDAISSSLMKTHYPDAILLSLHENSLSGHHITQPHENSLSGRHNIQSS
ncbi:hypothetical protein FSP39_001004 [Pinctada imbricata]|uniref:Uncharacterized protein n=1 Tax=Pinctada imbricata TaxID=66713 RepID=A0AA88YHC4_PINIB|nr:hypothetical protein FSP39_001004 [Pinctada imbricata]